MTAAEMMVIYYYPGVTVTDAPAPAGTPTPAPTATPTLAPTASPTPTAAPSATSGTPVPTAAPTATPQPTTIVTPSPTATPESTAPPPPQVLGGGQTGVEGAVAPPPPPPAHPARVVVKPGERDPTVPIGAKGPTEVWAHAWQDHPATDVAGFVMPSAPVQAGSPSDGSGWGPAAERFLAALVGWLAANGGLALGQAGG